MTCIVHIVYYIAVCTFVVMVTDHFVHFCLKKVYGSCVHTQCTVHMIKLHMYLNAFLRCHTLQQILQNTRVELGEIEKLKTIITHKIITIIIHRQVMWIMQ